MTAKIIWTLIFFCSIRGVYANAAKKEIAYTVAFTVTLFFSMYMLADLFGVLPPGFILNKNRIIKTKGLFLNEIVLFSI